MQKKVLPQWVAFGTEVRSQRDELGLSQAGLGKMISVSGAMIGHIERGTRATSRKQVDKLEEVFATDGDLLRRWKYALKSHTVPDWFKNALATEERAHSVSQYQPILIPGLLQTERYAEVLIRAWQPSADDAEIAEQVRTRTKRLPALLKRRPSLWFVVDEVVVTRQVGSSAIMAEQLEHIAGLVEDGQIRFQVLPQRPLHPGICPPFRLMELTGGKSVVFVEHALGDEARNEVPDIMQMRRLFGAMQADALAPVETSDYIHSIRKELEAA
ncbi:helix-turn-helix transcriptional regulator [Nocardiopsis eucommiae]|uniref:Helix-turn-helix transcriptional regulator n=1 Tax=Nocardiopsis eucommiae TaxID=2831970 RepID=A0A975QJE3_9ACTN|nr:helix-turn-helix transcriptional regulator [Nocardiopsis eucommiae]